MKSTVVELDLLIRSFFEDPSEVGSFKPVDASQVPSPSVELLDHNRHMTVTVEKHHGGPVDVKVLEHHTDRDFYSRRIVLTRQSDQRVVMYGMVRMRLSAVADDVRAEIESRKIPLGRVLIDHDVMREVQLRGLYEIRCGSALAQQLGCATDDVCYGRTAMIYCDGVPAIELLEIVGGDGASGPSCAE